MALNSLYKKIFLTGANGWLGGRILRFLQKTQNTPIVCLVPPGQPTQTLQKLGGEIFPGDLLNPREVNQFLSSGEESLVIHTAGIIHPPGRTTWFDRINYEGTQTLLNAATQQGCRRFIALSSNSPCGTNASPEETFSENSPYHPYMGYGKSKHKMELMLLQAMNQKNSPEITIIRAPWFYGPGQPPRQTAFFQMIQRGAFPLMGQGLNKRSMVYVDNLAQGILLAAGKEAAINQLFWMADERPYSMLEIVETVKAVLQEDFGLPCKAKNLHLPSFVSTMAEIVDGLLQTTGLYHQKIHVLSEMNKTIACDISKAKKLLGYAPAVELREGMHQSIQWCLENGLIRRSI
jgi:nucleoside-diphosphate-sugar epimerase